MLNVFDVADRLVSWATEGYGAEIDLIGYYGSYAQGVATEGSDLDIFYTPADGKNPPVSRTVLIEGLLFDFWPISWQQLEAFAVGHSRGWAVAPALVYHARLLYARSVEQEIRFAQIRQKIERLQTPEAHEEMIQRAWQASDAVRKHLGNLRLAVAGKDFETIRRASWSVVTAANECLALANQTFLDRGYASLIAQLSQFKHKPTDLEACIVTIATSTQSAEITTAAERLAAATLQTLSELQQSLPPTQPVAEAFENLYPELKAMVDKVRSACNRQDSIAAHAAAIALQNEVALTLALHDYGGSAEFRLYSEFAARYRALGFPSLSPHAVGSLQALAQWAAQLDARLRAWLTENAISLHEFASLEEFQRSLS